MKLSTDEIIAKSERIAKLVKRYRELSETDCKTDKEWIAFYEKTREITNLMREAQDELIEYSKKNSESIQDFLYRITASRLSDDDSDDDKDLLSLNMYSKDIGQRRKFAIITLRKHVGALAAAWDSMIEASSKEKQIDLFKKCKNSQELSAFNQAIISDPNTTDKQGNPCYTFHQGSFKLIARYTKGKLNQEAHMLFIYSRMMYKGNPIIGFTVEDYMAHRGLESKHRTVRQIKRGLEKLAATQFEITSKDKTSGSLFSLFGIHYKNNVIRLTLTPEGQAYFQGARAFAYLPTGLLLIDSQKNPHTIPLVMKLSNLKAMNHRKPNKGDTHKVSILIENTDIPTYQHVKEKMGRRYKDKIIDVFERDMNASVDILCWNYTEGSGNSWKEFKEATVSIQWIDHPQDKPAKSREAK